MDMCSRSEERGRTCMLMHSAKIIRSEWDAVETAYVHASRLAMPDVAGGCSPHSRPAPKEIPRHSAQVGAPDASVARACA